MTFTTDRTKSLTLLRRVLAVDAVVTTGNGLVYVAVSGPVGRLLGVSSTLLLGVGTFLVAYGLAVGYLASRPAPPVSAVRAVVAANAGWVVTSLVALAAWLDPSVVGLVWIPLQAAVVAGFAVLQGLGLQWWRAAR